MKEVERAADSEQDRATEDISHSGVEPPLPEDLVVRGLNLHEVDSTGNDREGKLQKMPQRHQGAPQNATNAAREALRDNPNFLPRSSLVAELCRMERIQIRG